MTDVGLHQVGQVRQHTVRRLKFSKSALSRRYWSLLVFNASDLASAALFPALTCMRTSLIRSDTNVFCTAHMNQQSNRHERQCKMPAFACYSMRANTVPAALFPGALSRRSSYINSATQLCVYEPETEGCALHATFVSKGDHLPQFEHLRRTLPALLRHQRSTPQQALGHHPLLLCC